MPLGPAQDLQEIYRTLLPQPLIDADEFDAYYRNEMNAARGGDMSVMAHKLNHAYAGTAIATALGGASLPADRNFGVSANVGAYHGQSALGAALQARVNQNIVVNAGVGVGFNQGDVGGRVGAQFSW